MKFCPGCARIALRTHAEMVGPFVLGGLEDDYESPCNFFSGKPRDELLEHLKEFLVLTPDQINQVLEHYGYEKVD